MKPSAIVIQPPQDIYHSTPDISGALTVAEEQQIDAEIETENLMKDEIVIKNFGKYLQQFVKFMAWPKPSSFFTRHENWSKQHGKVPEFNYVAYSDQCPKIHTPDRLEMELVSICKPQNFVYEG
jgi:hypothetical protein